MIDHSSPSDGPSLTGFRPTRRQFVTGAGAAVLATILRPVTSFAALQELIEADTTTLDQRFWAASGRASFVVLGDFGSGFNNGDAELTGSINVNAKAVADGIARLLPYHGHGPIICVGDAIYVPFNGTNSPEYPNSKKTWLANLSAYDQAVGVLYHRYIRFPKGSTSHFAKYGSRRQRFMTVLGDHDWWHVPRREVAGKLEFEFDKATYGDVKVSQGQPMYELSPGASYLDYFGNQGSNVRFFVRRDLDVSWFALSSDANETLLGTLNNAYYHGPFPSGYDPGRDNALHSVQGRWFRRAVRTAKTRWKFVNTHYPPYNSSTPTSGGHYSALYMRWAYARYGVDAVFSGHVHAYERLYVDGVTYVVTGAGGTFESFATFDNILPGSQSRVANVYGFVSAENNETGKIFFRYFTVRTPGTSNPPAIRDRFVLVRGGILDSKAEIEDQDGIHITRGGGRMHLSDFSANLTGKLLGTGVLRKSGSGTLRLAETNPDFTGCLVLEEGTLRLARPQALSENASWKLSGGTLTLDAGSQVSIRPFRLAGDAKIELSAGSRLELGRSDLQPWSGTLWFSGLASRSVRFGRDNRGLAPEQLTRIQFAEEPTARAGLDEEGFLTRIP